MELISAKGKKILDDDIEAPFFKRFLQPAFYKMLRSLSKFFPKGKTAKENKRSKLETNLALAGIRISPSEYTSARMIFTVGTIVLTIVALTVIKKMMALKILLYCMGVILAVYGPRFYLTTRIKSRQSAIRNEMPDVLDLLTVSVEAGLGFDSALSYISHYSEGPLIDEFNIAEKEIQMGRPRREAFKKMEERSNVAELKSFIGALIQTDQMGVPIKNVLQAQASQLRTGRKQTAEEKAQKAPIKMMFPLVVFIFPVIFIILLGPTVLQVIATFKG